MGFFEDLFGFTETDRHTVHASMELDGRTLTSLANGRTFDVGSVSMPSLAEFRASSVRRAGNLRVREVVANVQDLHRLPENAGAFFQVASQFNLLEMVSPSVSPDEGVSGYEFDLTQGPACAIACAPGTVYRNWFLPLDGELGQSESRQVDCLADLATPLAGQRWKMRNGYALADSTELTEIDNLITSMTADDRYAAMGYLRIGIHADTEVSLGNNGQLVTQAYCSALPIAYSPYQASEWESFAKLVLDASYEATMLAAAANAERTGNPAVFLTLLGGGAFGNSSSWIVDAMERAFELVADVDLDVAIVSYGSSSPSVQALLS